MATSEEKLGGLVRKKPVRIDEGVAYWKLDGYCDKTAIMRQGLSEVIMQYPFMLLIYIVVVSDY